MRAPRYVKDNSMLFLAGGAMLLYWFTQGNNAQNAAAGAAGGAVNAVIGAASGIIQGTGAAIYGGLNQATQVATGDRNQTAGGWLNDVMNPNAGLGPNETASGNIITSTGFAMGGQDFGITGNLW